MIIGVGFLLFAPINGAFKLFTVKELVAKPELFKKAGMISFPLETVEEGENYEQTIQRMVDEEIGYPKNEIKILGISKEEFHPIPGRPDISTFYGFGFFFGNPEKKCYPKDNDVTFYRWMYPEELMTYNPRRIEVEPILNHFLDHKILLLNEPN